MIDGNRRGTRAASPMPAGLVGALCLILGVELFIAGHGKATMDANLWTYEQARVVASEGVKDCDFLAFGDSLTKHGVAPGVVEERTGLRGYNLSLSGSQAPASYFLLREALRSGARPGAVLIDLFPCLVTGSPWTNSNASLWPVLASYRDCLDLGWHGGDARFFAALMTRKVLPSVRCRDGIRAVIVADLQGNPGIHWEGTQVALRHWAVNRGLGIVGNRYDPSVPLQNPINQFFQPIKCTPLNQIYIDRFMKLAGEHGVKVFLILPPYLPIMQAQVEEIGFDADHAAFARSMLDRYPALSVLDARRSGYEPSAFVDTHHLGFEGATTYSADLGEILRRRLDATGSADRWVAMPPFRQTTTTVKHEKIEESRLAVEALRIRR